MSIAVDLAQFAIDTFPDENSLIAEQIMMLSLHDWVACGIAGAGEPVARILRGMDHASGNVPVFAHSRLAPAAAALVNGATSHALDYDDTHFAHIGHPSVAVTPAALSCAESGEDLLWAALIGTEVSIRVGVWLGRSHYQTGFHQTATAGAFGAAAAAGRLLGLSQTQMQSAFGLAATQAAGLKSQFGTMGKPYHAGLAARTGVEAAQLAKAGFDTRGVALDGPQGFGPTHHGEADLSAFEGLGRTWYMDTISHKFHACCHGLHAALEALATGNHAFPQVEAVDVTTHPRWLSVCNVADPTTVLETKFSYRHTVAMALLGHDTASMDAFSDASAVDPELCAMRAKVTVRADDQVAETASRVQMTLTNGETLELEYDLDAPLPLDQRRDRLRVKARALLGVGTETSLWKAISGAKAPDLDALSTIMMN